MGSIQCLPTSLCSYNYQLSNNQENAYIEYDWLTEQGLAAINQNQYRIVKHGPMSGHWTLEVKQKVLIAAQKLNAFTRTFELSSSEIAGKYELRGESAFTRTMILTGSRQKCLFKPDHAFTRRATITGNWDSIELVVFSFWLVGLTWKRAQQSNSG